MKTYVLTVSKNFMASHPRKGEPTGFDEAIKSGRKIHTIRGNAPFWEKRIQDVQNGEAVLSIRQWADKPYRSKQVEIARLTSENGVGVQRVSIGRSEWPGYDGKTNYCYWAIVNGHDINLDHAAHNDGFSNVEEFFFWFDPVLEMQEPNKDGWLEKEFAIIHFTNFRYNDTQNT